MLRSEVIQPILNLFENPRYLEIGVEGGLTFHSINAAKKVAVDPVFRFDVPEPRVTDKVEYHEVISDRYFGSINSSELFDVIFVDGLHTNEQTLKDLLNSIAHLAPNGVIVIDDVLPSSYAASLDLQSDAAFYREYTGLDRLDGESWMGPVFRVVYFIAAFMQSFDYATIRENHGQTIMWRSIRSLPSRPELTLEKIAQLSYIDLLHDLEILKVTPYPEVFETIKNSMNHGG